MKQVFPEEGIELSLSTGGLVFNLMGRAGLMRKGVLFVSVRVLIIWLITWFPLLMLSMMEGRTLGSTVKVPFLYDFAAHIRFLIVVPVFVVADVLIEPWIRKTVRQFVETGLVEKTELPSYKDALQKAQKLIRSMPAELSILALVIVAAVLGIRTELSTAITSWQFLGTEETVKLTAAGWWFVFVGIPVYQFLLVLWLWRIFIWAGFLWRVSRLNLRLLPIHPDQAGGLGFLGVGQASFAPFILALSTVYSALTAEKIIYEGESLLSFKFRIAILIGIILVIFLAPLFVFTPKLVRARRRALLEYGALASGYVQSFEQKWMREAKTVREDILGSGDIQSLADLGNSFQNLRGMKPFPFSLRTMMFLAATAIIPFLPLLLTTFSLRDILQVLKGILL